MNFSEIEAQTKNKSVRFDKEVINSNNKIKIDENQKIAFRSWSHPFHLHHTKIASHNLV